MNITSLTQGLNDEAEREVAPLRAMDKAHGPMTSLGYSMSGGTGNVAQSVHDFLKKNNLPGQVITGALAEGRASDPQFQTNKRLEQGNVSVSPQEVNRTQGHAVNTMMGMTAPVGDSEMIRMIHPDDVKFLNQTADILGDNAYKGTPQYENALKNVQALAETYLPEKFQTSSTQKILNALFKGSQ